MRAHFINEKFTEDSDPIHDMGIGVKFLIKKWIKKEKAIADKLGYFDPYSKYRINKDLTISIPDESFLNDNCGDLPSYIQFNKIRGTFTVDDCNLTTLRGCPKYVGGDFECTNNKLTSLEYAPKYVGGSFSCEHNAKKFTEKEVRKVCNVIGGVYV